MAWLEHPSPWKIEHQLLEAISCPLNISGNTHHPFASELRRMRNEAIIAAREVPIAQENNRARTSYIN